MKIVSTPSSFINIESILDPFKKEVERLVYKNLSFFGKKNTLYEACEYALSNGGKRFRPALVLIIAKALGKGADVSQAALAVEYFHTASLIADDLPCMDNDELRRNKPCVHKIYGESIALLASYALIAEGYRCIGRNAEEIRLSGASFAHLSDRICSLALENATFNAGILGATGGQYLDLFMPDLSMETILETIQKKTVTLFEISFVFGWLFGGGDFERLDLVKKMAYHFGMAFQIADDLSDFVQDSRYEKTSNLAVVFGVEKAKKMFHEEIEQLVLSAEQLDVFIPELVAMKDALLSQVPLN